MRVISQKSPPEADQPTAGQVTSIKRGFWLIILISVFCISDLYAMDVDLWNLPQPPKSQKSWEDKAIGVNNINAHASRLTCELPVGEILAFYKELLLQRGWQVGGVSQAYEDKGVLGFTKEGRFLYLVVVPMGQGNDIYLLDSPEDLRVCRTLVDYFFKEEMAPDAPGNDLSDVPRYPASRRRLNISTQHEGAYVLYETDASPEQVGDFYKKVLAQYGWQLFPGLATGFLSKFSQLSAKLKDVAILFFERGEDSLYIMAYPTPREVSKARTLITITRNLGQELYPEMPQGE